MMNTLIASAALFGASTMALSVGSAHVVNKCSYDVWLCNVPASGGGYEEADQTLAAGESWSQTWTQLSNSDGWSIKLSQTDALTNILQYEYTFHNDGTIWYDLSCVNGNPWDGNWEITSSTSDCNPKQQAYRYATDDAYGMQSCPQNAAITVTLCSGEDADNSTSSSAPTYESTTSTVSYSATEASTSSPATTSTTEVPTSYPATTSSVAEISTSSAAPTTKTTEAASTTKKAGPTWWDWNNKDMSASLAEYSTPTTLVTTTTAVTSADGAVVTEVATAVVTEVVTAYNKRHMHHAHGHRPNA